MIKNEKKDIHFFQNLHSFHFIKFIDSQYHVQQNNFFHYVSFNNGKYNYFRKHLIFDSSFFQRLQAKDSVIRKPLLQRR